MAGQKRRRSGYTFRSRSGRRRPAPGAAPGHLQVLDGAQETKLFFTAYDKDFLREIPLNSIEEAKKEIEAHKDKVCWLEIRGLGNNKVLEDIVGTFSIHRLVMEDVVNTYQRPKMEEHHEYLFIVSRILYRHEDQLMNEQLSIFLWKDLLITLVEDHNDDFEPVRSRIRTGKGNIRLTAVDYLAYALLDSIVDRYFPLLEELGESLDEIESTLFEKPSRETVQRVQNIKRDLILFRKTIFPERDKISDMLRTGSDQISENTKVYLRDTYDHSIQVMDFVETQKEISASLMDIYLSSVSNRMNQVMKVLAIISTIFIPLTFIVGVYGMNFSMEDPASGKSLPMNMPELYHPYGYPAIMLLMVLIVLFQIVFFWKKGWLNRDW